ncbi:MAG: MEDS domain-containing protein [Chloroflexi bacterium]|nr:MEDS domain-containing protein [Chloroflexota bacterium]
METGLRNSGIDIIGNVPWGTHFCQFFESGDDLLDILVPYFKAGLENNEFCMWVTAEPVGVADAKRALSKAVPDVDRYLASGQLEILSYRDWYTKGGAFDSDRVLNGWVDKLSNALREGYDGLRLTGNTFWLEKRDWRSFADYERAVDSVIGQYRMVAICTYAVDKCGVSEVADVISNHQFALVKRHGRWEIIESAQRKRALDALREREEVHRRIVETASEGIWIVDADNKTTFVNQALADMLGYTADEMMGESLFAFMDEESRRVARITVEHRRQSSRGQHDFKFRRKDGTDLWAIVSTTPIQDKQGGYAGTLGMITDITERKRVEEERERLLVELQRRAAELDVANQELEAFSYSVSHDLRSPLRGIDGFSRALLEDYADKLDDSGTRYLQYLRQESTRMSQLIDNLLDLSRVTRSQMHVGPVDLSELADDVAEELRRTEPERSVELVIEPGLTASGDARLLRVLLENLLGNAFKFTSKHQAAKIEFGRVEQDGKRTYFVRDDGAGFDPRYADKLFRPFQRLHGESEFPGSGIGLATVQRIVHRHGGRVWAEGAVEQGATVCFTL